MWWLSSSSCPQDSGLGSQGPPGPGAGSRICPQPQPPAPAILVAPWRRRSSRRGAPAAAPLQQPVPAQAAVEGGLLARLLRPQDQGCCQHRPHPPRLVDISPPWRRLDLSEARSDRPREDWHPGLRIPHSGPAAPHLSAALLLLLLNFRHCHEKHPGVLDFDTACTLSRAHRRGSSPQGPRAACSRAAAPPGRSSLWVHQDPGSQGLPRLAGLKRGRVRRVLQGSGPGP
ncbi:uncharacterized protein LOC112608462 [Theropithecus gelada]|uniref:uncharacterized protein LOC112608462 n=1 Tax=Theropithecus gelada TaxID=9565 RepID=UPI000DC178B9|nr:uncharacterized protein LOC112608462 [Theropithecus gelada]